jgi:nitric oxide dioxygenase
MLSQTSRPVIEATLPVVAENIVDITTNFYGRLFAAHPQLLDGTFSRSNQRSGEQAKALAGSIAAFATHLLEHPDLVPERALARIAHKHAALDVRPEQYQVVYEHLFGAIAEVLGAAVTPEVASAWSEVYWLMANALIKIEAGLYLEQANQSAWTPWRVASIEPVAEGALAVRLEAADETPVTPSKAGHYVSVRVRLADGLRQARQYTLCNAPGTGRAIIVRPEEGGEVSGMIASSLSVGDTVELSNPYGELTFAEGTEPLVLVTGGIGATPTASMLEQLVRSGSTREVLVLHAERSLQGWALREKVSAAAAALPGLSAHVWLGAGGAAAAVPGVHVHEGRLDLDAVRLPEGASWLLCGPLGFMRAVRDEAIARGASPDSIAYEVFGPDVWGAEEEAFAAA